MKKTTLNLFSMACLSLAAVAITSCGEKQFKVEGTIAQAQDSILYLENISLDGPVKVDSAKLDADGTFSFSHTAPQAPEFYRLRIAEQQINLSVDSTETIKVKAQYPTMSSAYEVEGSDNCLKIKELALHQMRLQAQVNEIVNSPMLGVTAVEDSVQKVLEAYKKDIKVNYIFQEPMKAYAYYALFQTVVLGNMQTLVFNPRSSKDDVKVFAAVATSWDTYFPKAERGLNLHNIAIEGMKNVRIVESRQNQMIDASKIDASGIIDIALTDNKGVARRLSQLKGKVVLLDFHAFATEGSLKRTMMLRDLYNKYHAQGFEIFQVSLDPQEHFWKTKTEALPWVSVWDNRGGASPYLVQYNVQQLPTFFLVDRNNALQKRDVQIKDIDAEIKALL